jgi:hypothetical protein
MDQIVHIFRKDVRQHWYEIVLSLAILAALAWNEPSQWELQGFPNGLLRMFFSGWLAPLVTIGWLFLIVRVVHGESLVGDRQFWVTRPYEWKKLLAAKTLFFMAFINVPLLVVQVVLLWKAGYAPTSYVKGLLWMQCLWVLFLILPMTTLATLTASFGQTVLVVLGILLSFIGLAALSSVIPNAGLSAAESVPESLQFVVLLGACVAVVAWQYARRRTLQSRLLLIGAAGAILIIMIVTPRQALTAHAYPQPSAGQQPPVQLAFDPAKQTANDFRPREKDKVWLRIPLLVSGIAPDSAVAVDGIMVQIEGPGSLRWKSDWNGSFSFLLPTQPYTDTSFAVDKAFFERVKLSPTKIHISFALAAFRAEEVHRIAAAADEFPAPGASLCQIDPIRGILQCRSPLKSPFLVVTALSEESTCPLGENEKTLPPGTTFFAYVWNRSSAPAELGISSVKVFSLLFSHWSKTKDNFSARLCPGTPLTFSLLEEVQRTRSELTIDGLRLADYQLKDSGPGTAAGVGISVR